MDPTEPPQSGVLDPDQGTPIPRLDNGRKLHYIGEGYVVLTARGQERSTRKPVAVWFGVESIGHARTVLLPLDTDYDNQGSVTLQATGLATHATCYLPDDGPILEWSAPAYKWEWVTIQFEPMLVVMR